MNLKLISQEIKEIVSEKQKELSLTFVEDTHTYYMKNLQGEIVSDFPSVSTVLKSFYTPFDATTTKSFKNCEGDPIKEQALLKEWAETGVYASHMGSRVHFILEKHLVDLYGSYKDVRQPIFDCDEQQIQDGDNMIKAGKSFVDLMHSRGAVLLDTEMVLGSPELGYTGQPDKVWLINGKEGDVGLIITDWKGLPLNTPILTNSGWKKMGTLTKKDKVYDKEGKLVNILNISQVKNKKCLKMTFENGDEIISDFEHRWLVCKNKNNSYSELVMTTEEIENHLKNDFSNKLFIPVNKPLKTKNKKININPFDMGGKINSKNFYNTNLVEYENLIFSNIDDKIHFIYSLISKFGKTKNGYYKIKIKKSKLNLVVSIISSLGIKTSVRKKFLNYEVSISLSNLDFLISENKNTKENFNIDYYRNVISVKEVESVPTKCIEVDSPSSTFLCGHNLLVTHNTNKPKNFVPQFYTKKMLHPFEDYDDTALGHYFVQLPLYAKLLLKMLEGSKYENIPLLGGIVVLLTNEGEFKEFRIPKEILNIVSQINIKHYLK
jgi:hypothetical protein